MADMFKHKLVSDRFDKKKGAKDRKEALAKKLTKLPVRDDNLKKLPVTEEK